ncbi:FAD-dependent monooxygenase [Streptomyces canus]|uniref:FAD-dependent monooxygenase n=1 Tax=Streptomyces canus TaxID=58343 RepID=UPI0033A1AC03
MRIIRQLVYGFEARIAIRWRTGRVCLPSDAPHTMPPYLGQGACSGVRDATNLARNCALCSTGRPRTHCWTPMRASAAPTSPPSPTGRSAWAGRQHARRRGRCRTSPTRMPATPTCRSTVDERTGRTEEGVH